ncbi:hypothetical protein [Nannocystis bainbridge]|uniref:Lipoprotein n=1 Tax=Nannocystis bainbridge TaxID=2995303 RepID=A0ABT5E179_9BACT|nr:hypothetical protein [Nannocystis bainbridge]MDC0719079.1 hypothetical protein [Nannocystis bainbridge]
MLLSVMTLACTPSEWDSDVSGHGLQEAGEAGTAETGGISESTGTGTNGDAVELEPWYGPWYALSDQFPVNVPASWENGGSAFGFTRFELRPDGATLRTESCAWGPHSYEYRPSGPVDGVILLEPAGGSHEFMPHGGIDRLFIEIGPDCDSLYLKQVGKDDAEVDFLTAAGEPLRRGELCLQKCAEAEGEQGLISDCGTAVPWGCEG